MKKLIRPTVDCVFKAILGSNENKPLLINFLNAVLGLMNGQAIKDVVILNPYNEKEFQDDKLSIIDVLQLPFFRKEQIIEDDKDRWLYFFKEGQNLELDNLPENLKTKEIVKAMETLNHFSNDQKAYLLYQDRLEATRVASTWQSLLKQEKHKASEMQAAFIQEKQKASEMQAAFIQEKQKASEMQAAFVQEKQKASEMQAAFIQEKQKASEIQSAFIQEKQKASEMQAAAEQKDAEIQKLKSLLSNRS